MKYYCYVCGGGCKKEVTHGSFIYYKCADCFTSQVLPQLSETELQQFYDSFHLTELAGGLYDEVEDRMQADFPAKVEMVRKYKRINNLRLLDVGCGKGFFVKAALDRGLLAEGIDVSHSGIEYARNILGVKAKVGLLEKQNAIEWHAAFDAVTLWATIEHLADPLSVLRSIHENLKPGGIILCDTGLGNICWEIFLPGHSQWYDAPQHMFVFSKKGLVALLERAGFEVVYIDTNYDRSLLRRCMRYVRHAALCIAGGFFIAPLLGRRGFQQMREETTWPIGRLITVVAQKIG